MTMMQGDHGPALRRLRERVHLTLKEVQRAAGLSYSMIAMIERGENTTLATLDKVAKAVGGEAYVSVFDPRVESVVKLDYQQAPLVQRVLALGPADQALLLRLAVAAPGMSPEVRAMLTAMLEAQQRLAPRKAAGSE